MSIPLQNTIAIAHLEEQVKRWKDIAGVRQNHISQLYTEINGLRQCAAMRGPIKLTVADLPTVVSLMVANAPVGYRQNEWVDSIIAELNTHRRAT